MHLIQYDFFDILEMISNYDLNIFAYMLIKNICIILVLLCEPYIMFYNNFFLIQTHSTDFNRHIQFPCGWYHVETEYTELCGVPIIYPAELPSAGGLAPKASSLLALDQQQLQTNHIFQKSPADNVNWFFSYWKVCHRFAVGVMYANVCVRSKYSIFTL